MILSSAAMWRMDMLLCDVWTAGADSGSKMSVMPLDGIAAFNLCNYNCDVVC